VIRQLPPGKDCAEQAGVAIAALVGRARAGDAEALRLLYEQHQRAVYNLVYRMVGRREEAVDLTAEVFLRAFQNLRRLKTEAAFAAWLRRVAVNLCLDQAKRKSLPTVPLGETGPEEEGERRPTEPSHPGRGPEERLLAEELGERVRKALALLSPVHRAVILLHHLDGREVREIAAIMGCSEGTVKSRLGRARENLRRLLEEYVKG